ncbi:hypothetical protein KOW79_011374 [Hemibagrus wyckioides]|uniref:Uncharacterized protein n=1 Tax=Hemibagrus wyckioides TaxID=337641 RepID=A0A9D3NLC5_9TELE|nr:hypothetical protein KOW79_011374 [Hemibagrus wyckioides]
MNASLISFSARMQKMFLMVLCIFLCAGSSLQKENCTYSVAILHTGNSTVSCFRIMKDQCSKDHPTCRIEKRDDHTCIKWSTIDPKCVDNDLNTVPVENKKCGKDQESLSCTREFPPTQTPVENTASSVTIYCGGGYILLLFIIFVFF